VPINLYGFSEVFIVLRKTCFALTKWRGEDKFLITPPLLVLRQAEKFVGVSLSAEINCLPYTVAAQEIIFKTCMLKMFDLRESKKKIFFNTKENNFLLKIIFE